MNVSIEDAYREACAALGESIVTQRLLGAELTRVSNEVQRLSVDATAGADASAGSGTQRTE